MSVPVWVLRAGIEPNGERQRPKVKWYNQPGWKAKQSANYPYSPISPRTQTDALRDYNQRLLPTRYVQPSAIPGLLAAEREKLASRTTRQGNLDNSEYRFWCGAMIEVSRFAQCRACMEICHTEDERKLHKEKHKCTTTLVQAYNLLKRDRKCIVCDDRIHGKKEPWGIPLCARAQCKTRWMFTDTTTDALRAALALVKARERRAE